MTVDKRIGVLFTRGKGVVNISDFVKSVTITGDSTQFHRTCTVSLYKSMNGRTPAFTVDEGAAITFTFGGVQYFRGIVFAQSVNEKGDMSITAHDANAYFSKSTDSRIITKKKASDIVTMYAREFQIPFGAIADTGYVIPYLRVSNQTLRDTILKMLTITRKQTGKRYFMACDSEGKMTLKEGLSNTRYKFSDGTNLLGVNYSRSIEETKTQVKVIGGKKGKETVVIAKNDAARAKYGVLQIVEEMDESALPGQVKQRADTLLRHHSGVSEQLDIEVLGVPEVDVGSGVYVVNQMTQMNNAYYVTSITHKYESSLHTMSLGLSRTFELPDIEVNADELKK